MSSDFFFFAEIKVKREGGEVTLLGDNIGGGAVMLQPIKFRCTGVRIPSGLPCTYIYVH